MNNKILTVEALTEEEKKILTALRDPVKGAKLWEVYQCAKGKD